MYPKTHIYPNFYTPYLVVIAMYPRSQQLPGIPLYHYTTVPKQYKDRLYTSNPNVHYIPEQSGTCDTWPTNNYTTVPKYNGLLDSLLMYKRSLYFGWSGTCDT